MVAVAGQVGQIRPRADSRRRGRQTELTFRNIATVLETQGATLGDVVRVDVI